MDNQKILDWYQNEIEKDRAELDRNKKIIADSLKKKSKDIIFNKETKKISLWTKIKRVLMGI